MRAYRFDEDFEELKKIAASLGEERGGQSVKELVFRAKARAAFGKDSEEMEELARSNDAGAQRMQAEVLKNALMEELGRMFGQAAEPLYAEIRKQDRAGILYKILEDVFTSSNFEEFVRWFNLTKNSYGGYWRK